MFAYGRRGADPESAKHGGIIYRKKIRKEMTKKEEKKREKRKRNKEGGRADDK